MSKSKTASTGPAVRKRLIGGGRAQATPAAKQTKRTRSKDSQQAPSRKVSLKHAKTVGATAATPATGKLASVIALLRRPNGASIVELCKATGWQAHSVRGALSGTVKKKLGLSVASEKVSDVRRYRIAD